MEKFNKKYKATTEKKRQEKFFEEENMKIVYLEKEPQLKESQPCSFIQIETRGGVLLKIEGLI